MKSKEFIVEDTCAILWKDFLNFLNEDYAARNKIYESIDGDNIIQFIKLHTELPIVDKEYYFISIVWLTEEGSKAALLAKSDDLFKVIRIENNGRISVENTRTGKIRSFPEVVGPVTSNMMSSVLFNSLLNRDQFLMLFNLKFSDWRIKTKKL